MQSRSCIVWGLAATAGMAGITPAARGDAMTLLSNISANQPGGQSAGEIVSFDANTQRLFVTSSGGGAFRVNVFDVSNPAAPVPDGAPIDFSSAFGTPADMLGLSSVKVDPQGRFGVATLIPAANTTTPGKLGFFNLATGAVLGTSDVGFHPDSVTFSLDGSRVVVVNEGEFNPTSATNAPGSVSVIDVSGITAGNVATLPSLPVTTTDFSAGNLAPGVSISGLRNSNIGAVGTSGTFIGAVPDFNNPGNVDPNAMEPEYATVSGNEVIVSVQEANALATLDLTTNKWTRVANFGTITQTVDASNSDGGANIDDVVRGLPMPDTVGSYSVGGTTYVVTANEGDARVDDRDISRFGDVSGDDDMDLILDDNYPATATGVRANAELGRLNVSRIDGDTDADGKIDTITMLGTRSFSIWEQTPTGSTRVFDSGSFFEQFIKDNDVAGFADGRSDDKGPEPEGLVLGEIDGRTFAFIGMERTSGIFMFDVTDPLDPLFVDYLRIDAGADTPLRPEGFEFVPAALSPTGQNLLVVGFEGDGDDSLNERVALIAVVPEPAGLSLLAAAGALAWRPRRRRTT